LCGGGNRDSRVCLARLRKERTLEGDIRKGGTEMGRGGNSWEKIAPAVEERLRLEGVKALALLGGSDPIGELQGVSHRKNISGVGRETTKMGDRSREAGSVEESFNQGGSISKC